MLRSTLLQIARRGAATATATATTATETTAKKTRVAIVGSGWAGFSLARSLQRCKDMQVTLISPRNHFLFTPLLASTSVGTLEFRCVQEPNRTLAGVEYLQAHVRAVDRADRVLRCEDVYEEVDGTRRRFDVAYDKVVLCPGGKPNSFGLPGVGVHTHYLKELSDARRIRQRILELFEHASSPFVPAEEKSRMLTFVVVGGGPTSIEFASELYDFVQEDVRRWYPDLLPRTRLVVIEASGTILGSFHADLASYATKLFAKRNIAIMLRQQVLRVEKDAIHFKGAGDGSSNGNSNGNGNGNGDAGATVMPCGIVVWNTGVGASDLVASLRAEDGWIKDKRSGRLLVDGYFRCLRENNNNGGGGDGDGDDSVFAIGDCAVSATAPLPCTGYVAKKQAYYLASLLRSEAARASSSSSSSSSSSGGWEGRIKPFQFVPLGMMAYVGRWRAVGSIGALRLKGFLAFVEWRAAYWTLNVSVINKILIPMFWLKTFLLGRDISRF